MICLEDIYKGNSSVIHRKVQKSVDYINRQCKNVWMVVADNHQH